MSDMAGHEKCCNFAPEADQCGLRATGKKTHHHCTKPRGHGGLHYDAVTCCLFPTDAARSTRSPEDKPE
jgi:hypothetical protein